MTIQKETSKVVYIADGIASTFVIPFYFFNEDIAVYLNNSDTPLTENIDYTISNKSETQAKEVVFNQAPKVNTVITIVRNVPLNQLTTFIEGEKFPASDYENSLDKITMALQMLQEISERAIKITHDSNKTPEQIRELILDLEKDYDIIKKVPTLAKTITSIYEELLNLTTDTVSIANNQLITSKGVATHLDNNYYTKDKIDDMTCQKFGPILLETSLIKDDNSYSDYPYSLDIPITEAKSTHSPSVVLNLSDATSGNIAPISESYDGFVRIYLKAIPSASTIEIPIVILC